MTTMDSDSESQDSDDGRRFRFEATRKDSVAPVDDTTSKAKSLKKKSKHKSHRSESGTRYRERKERSRHESGRKTTDDKDLRHLIKHSKHESRSSRQENGGKYSHKDHRDARDTSAGSSVNDRGSRNSSGGGDARERSRDSKRQSDKDRGAHRAQRSREHSYERNHEHERASNNKHRSRERHKHRSRDKSRERSYQSNRIKSSNDGDRSREDHGKHDSSRKVSVNENRSQNSRDYSSSKNVVERARSHSETRSIENSTSENLKKDSSIDSQDCKELDLSQFDVLSETDENMSDGSDSRRSRTSASPHHRKTKLKRHSSSGDRSAESRGSKRARKQQEELRQVKARNDDDPASGSSNNNPSAVSDSLLGSTSSAIISVTRESCPDFARGKSEHCEEEERVMTARNGGGELSDTGEIYSRHSAGVSSDETRLLEKCAARSELTVYGPLLPMEFASNTSSDRKKFEETSSKDEATPANNSVDSERMNLIGPRLPRTDEIKSIESQLNNCQSVVERGGADDVTTAPPDVAFGPALPPHLLQRQRDNDSRDRIIGPALPNTVKPCKENAGVDSDDDCAIGPLPADHPALRNSHVHEQLDLRAQRIRDAGYSEEVDVGNKREEWMTELPSAQAASLGLGPRKFRLRDGPDMSDRSCWTDTPAQKAQKQKDLEARRLGNIRESDEKHVKEVHKKEVGKSSRREKSLLEIHQSKVAKKKKKEDKEAKLTGRSTRRPFDRDIDLQANRFDQAQKKTILMKARLLDDRFSHGQI